LLRYVEDLNLAHGRRSAAGLRSQFENELAIIKEAHDARIIADEEFINARLELEARLNADLEQVRTQRIQDEFSGVRGGLSAFVGQFRKDGEVLRQQASIVAGSMDRMRFSAEDAISAFIQTGDAEAAFQAFAEAMLRTIADLIAQMLVLAAARALAGFFVGPQASFGTGPGGVDQIVGGTAAPGLSAGTNTIGNPGGIGTGPVFAPVNAGSAPTAFNVTINAVNSRSMQEALASEGPFLKTFVRSVTGSDAVIRQNMRDAAIR